jgi:hypothetical protein
LGVHGAFLETVENVQADCLWYRAMPAEEPIDKTLICFACGEVKDYATALNFELMQKLWLAPRVKQNGFGPAVKRCDATVDTHHCLRGGGE